MRVELERIRLRRSVQTLAVLGLAACHGNQRTAPPPAPAAARAPAVARPSDPGVLLLAAIEDGRSAIGKGDQIAAENDLDVARTYALKLPDADSAVFKFGGRAGGPNSALVSDRLVTARARLVNGNLKGADQALGEIATAVPARVLPKAFPLIQAKLAIDLAQRAIHTGTYDQARAQLATAEAALAAAPAAPETAAARRALAQELRAAINDRQALRTLSSPRLAGWAAQVAAWAGL